MRNSEVEDSANVLQVVGTEAGWKAGPKAHSSFISGGWTVFISHSLSFLVRKLVHNAKDKQERNVYVS